MGVRLLARGMELPEETFVDMHNFDAPGETWGASFSFYVGMFGWPVISPFHEVVSLSYFLDATAISVHVTAIRAPLTTRRSQRMSGSRVTPVSGVRPFAPATLTVSSRLRHNHHPLEPARYSLANHVSGWKMAVGPAQGQRPRKYLALTLSTYTHGRVFRLSTLAKRWRCCPAVSIRARFTASSNRPRTSAATRASERSTSRSRTTTCAWCRSCRVRCSSASR